MSDPVAPTPFPPDTARDLAAVLDELIPPSPDGRLPGAGADEVGLVAYLEEASARTPDLRPALEQGLAALAELARRRGAQGFAELPAAERAAVLEELGTAAPAFLPGLLFQTYAGYYQQPAVLAGLGLPPRPPFPEGYDLEPGDLGLLDPVRARPRLWREV
jgi:hypothetical protein